MKDLRNILLLTGLVIALLLFYKFSGFTNPGQIGKKTSSATPTAQGTHEVTFNAPDGYKLSGTYYSANTNLRSPAIVLVHQFGGSRLDFDAFIPILQQNKYSILAYDIRSFGQSNNGSAQVSDYPQDVRGAIDFLKSQGGVDPNKIAIIGASIGANIAYIASGSFPEIKATVALSPGSITPDSVLSGTNLPNFSPHNIFVASDEKEKADADSVFSSSGQIKTQKVYPGAGHGADILKNSDAQKDILAFLQNLLNQ